MYRYSFDMTLSATSMEEANQKMQALATLARKLNATELSKLAEVVTNDPIKTKIAKRALGL